MKAGWRSEKGGSRSATNGSGVSKNLTVAAAIGAFESVSVGDFTCFDVADFGAVGTSEKAASCTAVTAAAASKGTAVTRGKNAAAAVAKESNTFGARSPADRQGGVRRSEPVVVCSVSLGRQTEKGDVRNEAADSSIVLSRPQTQSRKVQSEAATKNGVVSPRAQREHVSSDLGVSAGSNSSSGRTGPCQSSRNEPPLGGAGSLELDRKRQSKGKAGGKARTLDIDLPVTKENDGGSKVIGANRSQLPPGNNAKRNDGNEVAPASGNDAEVNIDKRRNSKKGKSPAVGSRAETVRVPTAKLTDARKVTVCAKLVGDSNPRAVSKPASTSETNARSHLTASSNLVSSFKSASRPKSANNSKPGSSLKHATNLVPAAIPKSSVRSKDASSSRPPASSNAAAASSPAAIFKAASSSKERPSPSLPASSNPPLESKPTPQFKPTPQPKSTPGLKAAVSPKPEVSLKLGAGPKPASSSKVTASSKTAINRGGAVKPTSPISTSLAPSFDKPARANVVAAATSSLDKVLSAAGVGKANQCAVAGLHERGDICETPVVRPGADGGDGDGAEAAVVRGLDRALADGGSVLEEVVQMGNDAQKVVETGDGVQEMAEVEDGVEEVSGIVGVWDGPEGSDGGAGWERETSVDEDEWVCLPGTLDELLDCLVEHLDEDGRCGLVWYSVVW